MIFGSLQENQMYECGSSAYTYGNQAKILVFGIEGKTWELS